MSICKICGGSNICGTCGGTGVSEQYDDPAFAKTIEMPERQRMLADEVEPETVLPESTADSDECGTCAGTGVYCAKCLT